MSSSSTGRSSVVAVQYFASASEETSPTTTITTSVRGSPQLSQQQQRQQQQQDYRPATTTSSSSSSSVAPALTEMRVIPADAYAGVTPIIKSGPRSPSPSAFGDGGNRAQNDNNSSPPAISSASSSSSPTSSVHRHFHQGTAGAAAANVASPNLNLLTIPIRQLSPPASSNETNGSDGERAGGGGGRGGGGDGAMYYSSQQRERIMLSPLLPHRAGGSRPAFAMSPLGISPAELTEADERRESGNGIIMPSPVRCFPQQKQKQNLSAYMFAGVTPPSRRVEDD